MNRRAVLVASGVSLMGARSIGAQTPSSEQANVDTVRRFYEEFVNALDVDGADGIIHPDYEPTTPGNAPGIDAFKARFGDIFQSYGSEFSEFAYIEEQTMAAGDDVAYRGRFTATSTDGKLLDTPDVVWFRFRDGLILSFWGGTDSGEISRQLYGF